MRKRLATIGIPTDCIQCGYHWQEEWEEYPTCHWEAKAPGDVAPCDEDPYEEADGSDEDIEWELRELREWEEMSDWYSPRPSSTGRDYSPSNPWDAPGMSVRDFI